MRKQILIVAAVLFTGTQLSAQAQTTPITGKPSTTAQPNPTQVEPTFADQKRAVSGELKSSLTVADGLLKKAMTKVSEAKPQDHDHYMKIADGIKKVQADLNDHLGRVNRATEKDGKSVFAKAQAVNKESIAALDGYKKDLGPAVESAPMEKTPEVK